MEVVCGSERFTAAGTPCRKELGMLGGHEGHKKGEKPGHCTSCEKEMGKHRSGRFIRGPALQPLGMQYKMVYWYCS